MKTDIVIVIYNRLLTDSPSYLAFRGHTEANLLICDNSTEPNDNAEIAASDGATYLKMDGNVGLPRAYHAAIRKAKESSQAEWLCLFDDDTEVDADGYLSALQSAYQAADILLPMVYDRQGLLSPCRMDGARMRRFATEDEIDLSVASGINSGMALRKSRLTGKDFDEGYFLDYVDHAFLRARRKAGATLGMLPIRVLHTPGHSKGSVVLLAEDLMLAGDTLFAGSCGRTDMPGGSHKVILESLQRLAELEQNYRVYPGHGESSTLFEEKKYNPYMRH